MSENSIVPLKAKTTNAGLAALFNAGSNGLEGWISHVAFGDGAGESYAPDGTETQLRRERARTVVSGGERLSPHHVLVQGVLGDGWEGWVREVGFFLNNGTLLAIWSQPGVLLTHKNDNAAFAFAYGLTLADAPANSVNVQITGNLFNVVFDKEFSLIIANQARLMRHQLHTDQAFFKEHGYYPGGDNQ
ncbi:MAG: hypothetical protein CSA70_03700 [Rhodobacterales bacterium]|nr:MAG: hypothetical protein CSA70_03700 [Rhodobacterales bacterium]